MSRKKVRGSPWRLFLLLILPLSALAHDPIFGIGPHTIYKGGVEVAVEVHQEKAGSEKELESALELVYGVTGDLAVGMEIPYVTKEEDGAKSDGAGDLKLFTKYRFWREDSLGLQEAAAVHLKVKTDSAKGGKSPALGSGSTDWIGGLSYGYEGVQWYRWGALRYRHNGENSTGLRKGSRWMVDLVGGYRPTPPIYREPDTVWLLELNGELSDRNEQNGAELANTGGDEWFISPGIFWTQRNLAVKAGVQIPISHDLNGIQDESDLRAKLVVEWHL